MNMCSKISHRPEQEPDCKKKPELHWEHELELVQVAQLLEQAKEYNTNKLFVPFVYVVSEFQTVNNFARVFI